MAQSLPASLEAMHCVGYAPATNRRVIGAMNELALLSDTEAARTASPEVSTGRGFAPKEFARKAAPKQYSRELIDLTFVHQRFCEQLPDDLLWVEDPMIKEKIKVVPGELRSRDVQVGGHVPISAPAVPHFLKRYEEV
jgi:hypothetical protein